MGAVSPQVPISAGRQCRGSFGSGSGASREEAPEESIFLKRDAVRSTSVRRAKRDARVVDPRRAAEHRTVFARSFGSRQAGSVERSAILRVVIVGRSGSSSEGAVGWKATPELVSQDREAGSQTHSWERDQGRPNTGRSFARRSGGWQQCRPPFLYGVPASTSGQFLFRRRRC